MIVQLAPGYVGLFAFRALFSTPDGLFGSDGFLDKISKTFLRLDMEQKLVLIVRAEVTHVTEKASSRDAILVIASGNIVVATGEIRKLILVVRLILYRQLFAFVWLEQLTFRCLGLAHRFQCL